jgi:hypothetical protein
MRSSTSCTRSARSDGGPGDAIDSAHTLKWALTDPRVFDEEPEAICVAWYASAGHFDESRTGRRSDEIFERGENFRGYRAVPSVIDYLLVAHDRVRVEHYTRSRDDTWVLREHGPGSRLRPASGAGEIAIDESYRKVSLDHLPVRVSTRSSYVLDERHRPAGLAPRFAG